MNGSCRCNTYSQQDIEVELVPSFAMTFIAVGIPESFLMKNRRHHLTLNFSLRFPWLHLDLQLCEQINIVCLILTFLCWLFHSNRHLSQALVVSLHAAANSPPSATIPTMGSSLL